MRDDARRTVRIITGLALAWGIDIAGILVLPVRELMIVNGATVAVSFAVAACWIERRARTRARAIIGETQRQQAALIKTIEHLTGAQTGPIPALRDVA